MRVFLSSLLLAFSLIAPLVGIGLSLGEEDPPYRSTSDGVYTKEQAERGKKIQRRSCFHCHQPDYYKGGLIDTWAGNTVGALNTLIINTMPEDRPSSLKPQKYADLMAYILELNGFPTGEDELPSDDELLSRIVIERKTK